jgi:TolB protein
VLLSKSVKQLFGICVLALSVGSAQAVLKIDITEGVEGASPIAVVPFNWSGTQRLANADMTEIINSDLARSGQFAPLPGKDLIARPSTPEKVDFKTWRIAGVDHLVIGTVKLQMDNTFQVQFRLLDILKAEQSLGYSFSVKRSQLRSVAHRISDYIVEHLTGLKPVFDSRISYITAQQQQQPAKVAGKPPLTTIAYKLQVADTDGFNPQTLLNSPEPIMSPGWSPDGRQLVYVSFEKGKPEIYIHDIFSGARQKLAAYKGINGAPQWSPDGKSIAMTLSKDGNPDIYVLQLQNKSLRRITKHWAIDTEPSWMPDSRSLVFTSSRSGKPQLYSIRLEPAARPSRLTFEGNYNANATVSQDGKSIAFVHGKGNVFKIASLQLETRYMNVLTDGPLDESPEFAPNGSMIIYARQDKGKAVLAAVSADGRHKQKLVLEEGDVREPAWAPKR